ncbi:MAG: hypothetical protein EPN82_13000 [Bacteroidetes bacterium]|nr:MAG: hypothetical protein EPN82_13000 [Bacteroidota bacterium]
MAEYPSNYRYQASNRTLHWDAVDGAEEYQIEFTTDPQMSGWQLAYSGGIDTVCSFMQSPGIYSLHGRVRKGGPWDIYGPIEFVEVLIEP